MYRLSRAIQFLGLVVAGAAFFVGLLSHDSRRELMLLGVGAAIFFGGQALQRSAK
jgi:hypothetical protein